MTRGAATLRLAGLLLLLGAGVAAAQVSPGPLSRAHAELDGPTQCFRCHAKSGGRQAMEAQCLSCHKEIAWMKRERRGTHARHQETCVKCHPDHGGRDFALIAWPGKSPRAFDHRTAGWPLEGAHRRLECSACHQSKLQRSGAMALAQRKDPSHSWLGLETSCASCHDDPHRKQLGSDCASCHDQTAWKPAAGFDHAKARFPLTGRHADVPCARCHEAEGLRLAHDARGQAVPQYKPLAFDQCSSCHQDPHRNRFGPGCGTCHRTSGWSQVREEGFDHGRTRFPLLGRHRNVSCASCHSTKTAWGKRPAFARCDACHVDAHAGKALLAGAAADCAACHDVHGFARSTMPRAAHQQTGYPLEGAHRTTDCASCHTRAPAGPATVASLGPSRVRLDPAHETCTDCHGDPHRGRFASAHSSLRDTGSCASCHDMTHFVPSRYDAQRHARSGYPLAGAHLLTPCSACHGELTGKAATATLVADSSRMRSLRFVDPRRRCAECHANPHGRQFDGRAEAAACDACHDLAAFAPAARFDHTRDAGFPLEGGHAKTACTACHKPAKDPDGVVRVRWKPVARSCEACHGGSREGDRKTGFAPRTAPPNRGRHGQPGGV